MTEQNQRITGDVAKKKRSLVLPIAAAVVTVALVGFLASRAGLDKALVKQQVDNFIVQMKERGKAQGRDLNLVYGELEVVGSFASKHVVIHEPVLTVKPLERQAPSVGEKKQVDALVITTPTIAIYPQSVDLSSLRVEAAEPIDFAAEEEPTKSLLKVTSDVPLSVSVTQKKVGEVPYTDLSYASPTQMVFTYLREQQAAGAEEQTPTVVPVYQTLQMDVAKGSAISSSLAADGSGLGEAKINFKDVVLTPKEAPEGAVKLAEITGSWNNILNEKKLNAVHALLKMGPVTSDNTAAPYLPVTVDVDATYEGMMGKTPESIAQVEGQESSMVLKSFAITTKDASLNATANFTASASDVLPVGTANIALSNAPFVLAELRKYGVLNPKNEPLVMAVLQRITGTAVDQLKDVAIPVERIRGGAFKIGNSTFEELFALVLSQAMQMKNGQPPMVGEMPAASPSAPSVDGAASEEPSAAPLVPTLPPADKPKAAPIEVPDHGVRG